MNDAKRLNAFDVVEATLRRKGIEPPWTVTEPAHALAAEILADLHEAGFGLWRQMDADDEAKDEW